MSMTRKNQSLQNLVDGFQSVGAFSQYTNIGMNYTNNNDKLIKTSYNGQIPKEKSQDIN